MSKSELRAHELFNALNLRNEDEDVRRNLIILMLSIPQTKKTKSFTEKYAGKWQGDNSAEDIIATIREARTLNQEIEL